MANKRATLRDDLELQPHQQRLADEASRTPLRKLMLWHLGSGKSLGSLAASEARGEPFTAIMPAALRENYKGERRKFTDEALPLDILSYTQLARGRKPRYPTSLVFDEVHRLRNPESAASQQAQEAARQAKQLLLLTGTPTTNRPGDLAPLVSMLTGQEISPDAFERRYVKKRLFRPGFLARWLYGATPGEAYEPTNLDEVKALLTGHVDYYAPLKARIPVNREDHVVEMSPEQTQLYQAMWKKLPLATRWKLQQDFPLSSAELLKLRNFLSGPRQVGLSTYPYLRVKDPYRAYLQSPKLQKAVQELKTGLTDPRSKALVFSNFIDAGLVPYASALERENIPFGLFHGGLSDQERKKLIDDYNADKLRVALVGPAGMEGLSFKGTQLLQLLDPHFHPVRPRQAEGRALRYDSHDHLPEELRHVRIQRFLSRLPPGLAERLKARLSFRTPSPVHATDDHLLVLSARKEELNRKFDSLLKELGTRT